MGRRKNSRWKKWGISNPDTARIFEELNDLLDEVVYDRENEMAVHEEEHDIGEEPTRKEREANYRLEDTERKFELQLNLIINVYRISNSSEKKKLLSALEKLSPDFPKYIFAEFKSRELKESVIGHSRVAREIAEEEDYDREREKEYDENKDAAVAEEFRKEHAEELGLPESASWEDINAAMGKGKE